MKIEDAREGRKVVYTPFKGCNPFDCEVGIITSVTEKYVFVRYGADVNSKATKAEDIEYELRL